MNNNEIIERLKDAYFDRLYGSSLKDQYNRLLTSIENIIEDETNETPDDQLGYYSDED